jgi:hypothetical protein
MRFLPQSLNGQLIAITVAALLASHVAGPLVMLNDRKSLLNTEWLHNVLVRAGTVADILDATPPEFHQKILNTASRASRVRRQNQKEVRRVRAKRWRKCGMFLDRKPIIVN